MEDICRLCCSTNFVNNDIFDEENALYVKMSLYLPIKVFKNDRLPQKVCDKCSCKVNDFYQFCNETIEVQNRLRALFLPSDSTNNASVNLTLIKDNASPLPSAAPCEQSTQTETNKLLSKMDIKQEPTPSPTLIKQEVNSYESDHSLGNCSDNSDDMSLISLKKRKNSKKEVNGIDKKTKKKKPKLKDWEMLMKALPEGTAISLVDKTNVPDVKEECKEEDVADFVMPIDMKKVKSEANQGDTYHCCVCLAQCYSRSEMRQHYRVHKEPLNPASEPAPPPPPPGDRLRCTRCRKEVTREGWATHWQRHWQRDRRPYRCALCEKSFRDHHQILKHGLTHSAPGGAVRVRLLPRAVRVHAVPAGAPHARAPRGSLAAADAALRHVRALLRSPELAAAPPALPLGRAQLPVQRVRQGAVLARTPQVPHPHPHGLQAQRVQDVRQGVREEVQPDAARARALRREAARVFALRQGVQPALHTRHPRAVPQRHEALRVRPVWTRLRRQGTALHASQDHLHIAAHQGVAGGGRAGDTYVRPSLVA